MWSPVARQIFWPFVCVYVALCTYMSVSVGFLLISWEQANHKPQTASKTLTLRMSVGRDCSRELIWLLLFDSNLTLFTFWITKTLNTHLVLCNRGVCNKYLLMFCRHDQYITISAVKYRNRATCDYAAWSGESVSPCCASLPTVSSVFRVTHVQQCVHLLLITSCFTVLKQGVDKKGKWA